ncbi:MAG: hypothetical protein AUJ74_03325 [Candidatus Omnitrophica bacterium CG1_02_44_16]|nr:MAG: hypothetical protein AUJ74_03325 [Candidatus Omnitrophica bacterium CG1_02_44_16]PIY83178.1 MAG: ribonuclease H [Candidatus Omnitrophica bacterium CG_4_10_14_0_8_um_filter_44_12]PIZ83068.1 MAG: ribonuclease H [Candidatus Omnitrophica bacterium CG_4_10_14_0_2_um_filter_44_9]
MYNNKTIDIYIDGSSIGNPGDSGIGVMISSEDVPLKNISKYIGKQTNNFAEYTALVFALQEALIMKAASIKVFSDSELLCKQMSGEYRVKSENIKNLFEQAINLLKGFKDYAITHIPREQNSGADKLARLAIKRKNTH